MKMSRIHVVYASRHGGTAGIASRVAEVLRADGLEVVLSDAADRPAASGFDATLVGAGVYLGSWVKEGVEFLERNQATLATMPVWLFSSGPLPGSTKETDVADPVTLALGPEEGPGSGGHRKINELSAVIHPRGHRVFTGAYDPSDPPKNMTERLVRMMPGSKGILPIGDFREWDDIEAWAREVAGEVKATVPAPIR
jgi:menaquinone-dependent protoporphyrinogen oxidase